MGAIVGDWLFLKCKLWWKYYVLLIIRTYVPILLSVRLYKAMHNLCRIHSKSLHWNWKWTTISLWKMRLHTKLLLFPFHMDIFYYFKMILTVSSDIFWRKLYVQVPNKQEFSNNITSLISRHWQLIQEAGDQGTTINNIPHILWDVIICPCPWYLPHAQHYSIIACFVFMQLLMHFILQRPTMKA